MTQKSSHQFGPRLLRPSTEISEMTLLQRNRATMSLYSAPLREAPRAVHGIGMMGGTTVPMGVISRSMMGTTKVAAGGRSPSAGDGPGQLAETPRGILGVRSVTGGAVGGGAGEKRAAGAGTGRSFSRTSSASIAPAAAAAAAAAMGNWAEAPTQQQQQQQQRVFPATSGVSASAGGAQRKKKWRPHCQHPTCLRPASYAGSIDLDPVFCEKHKTVGQQNVVHPNRGDCESVGCGRVSAYASTADTRARFCHLHKEEGMVKVRDRIGTRCEEATCIKQASFALEGDRYPKFCKDHRHEDMVNIRNQRCLTPGCSRGASFAACGNQRGQFCAEHKGENMINTRRRNRCMAPGCVSRDPIYYVEGQQLPKFCAGHKGPGMLLQNTVNRGAQGLLPESGVREKDLAPPVQDHQLLGNAHRHDSKADGGEGATTVHSLTSERVSRPPTGLIGSGSSDGSTSINTSPTLNPGGDVTANARNTLGEASMTGGDRGGGGSGGGSLHAQQRNGMMVDLDLNRHRVSAPRFPEPHLPRNQNDSDHTKARLVPAPSTRAWRVASDGEESGSDQTSSRVPPAMGGSRRHQQSSSAAAATHGGTADSGGNIGIKEEGMLHSAAPGAIARREQQEPQPHQHRQPQPRPPRPFDCMDDERLGARYPSAPDTATSYPPRVVGDLGVASCNTSYFSPSSSSSCSPPPPPPPLEFLGRGGAERPRIGAESFVGDDSDRDSAILMMRMRDGKSNGEGRGEAGNTRCRRPLSPPTHTTTTTASGTAGAHLGQPFARELRIDSTDLPRSACSKGGIEVTSPVNTSRDGEKRQTKQHQRRRQHQQPRGTVRLLHMDDPTGAAGLPLSPPTHGMGGPPAPASPATKVTVGEAVPASVESREAAAVKNEFGVAREETLTVGDGAEAFIAPQQRAAAAAAAAAAGAGAARAESRGGRKRDTEGMEGMMFGKKVVTRAKRGKCTSLADSPHDAAMTTEEDDEEEEGEEEVKDDEGKAAARSTSPGASNQQAFNHKRTSSSSNSGGGSCVTGTRPKKRRNKTAWLLDTHPPGYTPTPFYFTLVKALTGKQVESVAP
ncbi:unnamed protein product [Scytosiphon promiscuus]